jgi:hypothetical protein
MNDDIASRQHDALFKLNDELWSMLHAYPLRQDVIASATVRDWLWVLLGYVYEGLGKSLPPQPKSDDEWYECPPKTSTTMRSLSASSRLACSSRR